MSIAGLAEPQEVILESKIPPGIMVKEILAIRTILSAYVARETGQRVVKVSMTAGPHTLRNKHSDTYLAGIDNIQYFPHNMVTFHFYTVTDPLHELPIFPNLQYNKAAQEGKTYQSSDRTLLEVWQDNPYLTTAEITPLKSRKTINWGYGNLQELRGYSLLSADPLIWLLSDDTLQDCLDWRGLCLRKIEEENIEEEDSAIVPAGSDIVPAELTEVYVQNNKKAFLETDSDKLFVGLLSREELDNLLGFTNVQIISFDEKEDIESLAADWGLTILLWKDRKAYLQNNSDLLLDIPVILEDRYHNEGSWITIGNVADFAISTIENKENSRVLFDNTILYKADNITEVLLMQDTLKDSR